MRHYNAAMDAQEREHSEAIELARELHDALDEVNEAIKRAKGLYEEHTEGMMRRIYLNDETAQKIEKLLAKAFSWRTQL